MGRIRVLPDAVVNKIAAGEVVERPASVLKELIENALDAGATRIDVEAEAGGRAFLRVTDDGGGMAPDDALLAFDRHATSKLSSADELTGIATLGFRGEALPSIAAVSRTALTTRRPEDLSGTRVAVAGGRVGSSGEVGAPAGTTVEVRDLFFNVPARKAFLRVAATEGLRLQETLAEAALARPEVAFSLTLDGRRTLSLPAAENRLRRAGDLLGGDYTGRMATVATSGEGVSVEGLVSRPGFDFAGWEQLHTLVNGRPVRSPLLLRAVGGAFGPYAAPGRKPAAILWITVPGETLDVNVHPTKKEVRFREGGAVARTVERAIREALAVGGAPGTAGVPNPWRLPSEEGRGGDAAGSGAVPSWIPTGSRGPQGDLGWLPAPPAAATGVVGALDVSPVQDIFLFSRGFRLLGQFEATYLVVESQGTLYLIDQHVAHERILFENYKRDMAHGIAMQELIAPIVIGVSPGISDRIEEVAPLLERFGLAVEAGGPTSILVRSVPHGVPTGEAEALARDLIGLVAEEGPGGELQALDAAAARLACAGAIKAGQPLSPEEAGDLVRRLGETANPYRCPHGRPIVVSIPRPLVDRAFGRG